MVLPCPACGTQHIDRPAADWPNPPHRSHLCEACGCIWRPADVPTVGVAAVRTHSTSDTWPLEYEAEAQSDGGVGFGDVALHPPVTITGAQCRALQNAERDEGDLLEPPTLLPACNKAPLGYRCTRGMGHDGFCATVPEHAQDPVGQFDGGLVERQAVLEALAHHDGCCAIVRRIPYAHG